MSAFLFLTLFAHVAFVDGIRCWKGKATDTKYVQECDPGINKCETFEAFGISAFHCANEKGNSKDNGCSNFFFGLATTCFCDSDLCNFVGDDDDETLECYSAVLTVESVIDHEYVKVKCPGKTKNCALLEAVVGNDNDKLKEAKENIKCPGNPKNCAVAKAFLEGMLSSLLKTFALPVCGIAKEMKDGQCKREQKTEDDDGSELCFCNGALCNVPPLLDSQDDIEKGQEKSSRSSIVERIK